MGISRIHRYANRSAVRALGAAHLCPDLGGTWSVPAPRRAEGQELPVTPEPPVE